MSFDSSLINEIDPTTVEGTEATHPLVQWCYGDPKLAKHGGAEGAGGWFITFENMPGVVRDDLTAAMKNAGWVEDSITTSNGDSLEGLYSSTMSISVVNMRKRWRASDGQRSHYFAWNWDAYSKAVADYGRATSQIHVYAIIKGLEEFAPFVLTMSGSAAMAFEGTKKLPGALDAFHRTVVAAANAQTKNGRWPYRAFWLTVAAARDKAGKPMFTEVGKGKNTTHVVLPVAVGLPADIKAVNLDEFALEKGTFRLAQDLYSESVEWKTAWDRIGEDNDDHGASAEPEAVDDVADTMAELGL